MWSVQGLAHAHAHVHLHAQEVWLRRVSFFLSSRECRMMASQYGHTGKSWLLYFGAGQGGPPCSSLGTQIAVDMGINQRHCPSPFPGCDVAIARRLE